MFACQCGEYEIYDKSEDPGQSLINVTHIEEIFVLKRVRKQIRRRLVCLPCDEKKV